MGPGCFHPRNAFFGRPITSSPLASMGPGCFHPRNPYDVVHFGESLGLQWGRDVSIPEIWIRWRTTVSTDWLQWGRDVSIPEISVMLPWSLTTATLQWGRDVSIPEIWQAPSLLGLHCRFNGAGMFPSQKWRRWSPEGRTRSGFNGAGMFPSQKCGC